MRLLLNNTELIQVSSKKRWNETAVEVYPGEEYEFLAVGTWADLFNKAGADGYDNAFLHLFDKLKRDPVHKWFALMGTINKQFHFLVGECNKLKFDVGGKLSFYANDIPGLYWGNSKSISLFVTRRQ